MTAEPEKMPPLSRELALKIALAARELPDTSVKRLLAVLVAAVGLPLTEEALATLTVKALKTAADNELAEMSQDALKAALLQLKTGAAAAHPDPALPCVVAYQAGEMPGSIRVACASNGYTEVDGHFGSCARFLVYQVSKDEIRLIAIQDTNQAPALDDKNSARVALLQECHLLYVASIGGPAAAKVVKAGMHPIKLPQGGQISTILVELKQVLAEAPPPWLAKVMGQSAQQRVRFALTDSNDGEALA